MRWTIALSFIVFLLLAQTHGAWAGESLYGVNPDAPPGTETPQGDMLRGGKAPQPFIPEVQPGTESPQDGSMRLSPGAVSSGDEDEIDDLEIERLTVDGVSTPGGEVSGVRRRRTAGDVSSGDEDDIDDQEIERLTVDGVSTPGLDAGGAPPSVGGGAGLPGTLMKPKETGGGGGEPAAGQKKTPKFRSGKALKDSVNLEGTPTRLRNCGTFWTGRIEDPDSAINPCPKGCVRGEATLTSTYKSGDKTYYEIRYQCYFEDQASGASLPSGVKKNLKAGEIAPGSAPAGALTPDRGPWHTFVRVTGDRFNNATGVRVLWYPDDDDSQELAGSTSATLRKRLGRDGVEIEMPRGAGGAQGGVVRVMVNLPDSPEPVFAGRFTVDDGSARNDLRKKAGADVSMKSTASTAGTAQPAGAGEPRPVTGGNQGVRVAGEETASTQSGIVGAPGAGQISRPPAADREVSTRNMNAPGPTILAVSDVAATALTVKWKPVAGASGYVLHAAAKGLNHAVDGAEVKATANQPVELSAQLTGLVPGAQHSVWVSASYPDGRLGISEQKAVTTAAAENPKGFKAVLIGPGAVRLEWEPSPGAVNYRVEGANLPRMQTTDTAVAVSNLSPGAHEWTLVAAYALGVYNDLNPSRLSATVAPDVSGRARYRVTVNGFKVNRETVDTVLQSDGKGDEVRFAAFVAEYSMTTGQRLRSDVAQTPVFGDKNGFGVDRILAGSISESGGLRRNDAYPNSNPAFRTGTPSYLDMPYIIWEGDLVAGENYIVFAPTIWEWDGEGSAYDYWKRFFDNPFQRADFETPFQELRQVLEAAASQQRFSGWPQVTLTQYSYYQTYYHDSPLLPLYLPDEDRPIGILKSSASDTAQYRDHVFALNREFVEGELSRSAQTSLPPGVLGLQFVDDRSGATIFGGDYTLYLQVERLP